MRGGAWLLWIVGVTLLAIPLVPAGQHRIGPGVVSIEVGPALRGTTTLSLPPLGRVRANTHPAPVEVTAELRELDVQPVISGGGRLDAESIEADVRADLPGAVASVLVRLLAIGALLGGIAAAVLPRRRLTSVVLGALVGALTVGLTASSVLVDFDASRFEEPTYDGSLGLGGPLLAAVTSGDASGLDARVDVLAERLANLYSASVTTDIARSEGNVAILHISDIHLNPIGLNLARDLARSFEVDAIVDTGDTTSFGLPIEEPFSELFDDFGAPYYFVAGNHDSMANRLAISEAPGVTSIDREVVEVKGLRILGFDDPVVTTTRTVPKEQRARTMEAAEPELRALVERESPDVVAIHNPAMASAVTGEVPVVMAGHLHRSVTTAQDGTVIAVAGSTGATGLGSLTVLADKPYQAQVLRFDDGELVAIDNIELIGTSGNFVVRRTLITEEFAEGVPDPVLEADPEEPTLEDRDGSTGTSATTSTGGPSTSPGASTTAPDG
jgi:predicted phosphodiesterase